MISAGRKLDPFRVRKCVWFHGVIFKKKYFCLSSGYAYFYQKWINTGRVFITDDVHQYLSGIANDDLNKERFLHLNMCKVWWRQSHITLWFWMSTIWWPAFVQNRHQTFLNDYPVHVQGHLIHYGVACIMANSACVVEIDAVGREHMLKIWFEANSPNDLCDIRGWLPHSLPQKQGPWGQHGTHLGLTGPRWAPCWPHELCSLGSKRPYTFTRPQLSNCTGKKYLQPVDRQQLWNLYPTDTYVLNLRSWTIPWKILGKQHQLSPLFSLLGHGVWSTLARQTLSRVEVAKFTVRLFLRKQNFRYCKSTS